MKIAQLGVRTVAQLERLPLAQLVRAVGEAHGRHLHDLAHAVDPRPVVPDQRVKSVSHEETFAEDIDDPRALHTELVRMADAVGRRARSQDVAGRTVSIKVRFGDFTTISRSVTLPQPVDTGPAIVRAATRLTINAPPVITSARLGCIDGSALISSTVSRLRCSSSSSTSGSGMAEPCTFSRSY